MRGEGIETSSIQKVRCCSHTKLKLLSKGTLKREFEFATFKEHIAGELLDIHTLYTTYD